MTDYGSVTVSSVQQKENFSIENQKEQLVKAGIKVENIVEEQGSAGSFDREKLNDLVGKLKKREYFNCNQI